MKRLAYALVLVLLGGGVWAAVDNFRVRHPVSGREITVPGQNGANAMLVSGWMTTPAGRHLASGDMILSGQVSPDGSLFAFTNSGYTRHAVHIVDLATEKEIATFPVEQAWSGLAFTPDGRRLYVSSGAGYRFSDIQYFDRWDKEGWKEARTGLTLLGAVKEQTAVSWLGVSPDGKLLYALNNSDEHLYVLETHGGRAVARLRVGDHPISAELSRDGKTLYVANLGSANIAVVDVSEPARPAVAATLATDAHPNDIVLTADDRLFVSCGNSNNVIAFDLKTSQRLEVISTALGPKAPAGSTPNSLALSPDGDMLYVANADNNSVAVIDVAERGKARPLGFLPTGWYPDVRDDIGGRQAHHRRERQGRRHRTVTRQAADRSDRAGGQLPAPRQPVEWPGVVHRRARCGQARRLHEAGLRQRPVSRTCCSSRPVPARTP